MHYKYTYQFLRVEFTGSGYSFLDNKLHFLNSNPNRLEQPFGKQPKHTIVSYANESLPEAEFKRLYNYTFKKNDSIML